MTSLTKILKSHPSFTAAEDFDALCKPLEQLEIHHFSYVRVDANGQFSLLSKNPEVLKHYLKSEYYYNDVIQLTAETQEQYFLRDLQQLTGKTRQWQDDLNNFGFGHAFTILRSSPTQLDFYNFGTHFGNTRINEYYLQKLDMLKQFICFLHDKIDTKNHLKQADNYKLPLQGKESGFQQQVCDSLAKVNSLNLQPNSRYYLPGTQCYLTQREYECLSWLAKGKTQDEIAILLGISLRTVRAHVTQIKEKLQCYNQFQLGMYFSKFIPYV